MSSEASLSTQKSGETVESLLKEFEQITRKLELDDVTLEKSLELYARGLEINLMVKQILNDAERRVVEIIKPDGTIEPFTDKPSR